MIVHHSAAQASKPKATVEREETEALLEEQTGTLNQSILHHVAGEASAKGCVGYKFPERGLKMNF